MMFPDKVVVLFCIYFYLLRVGDMRSMYSNVNGLWWQHRWRSIIEAVANIILNIALAKYFGIYGIITATILTLFFIQTFWGGKIVFQYYFGMSYIMNYFKYHVRYAVATAGLCILTKLICDMLTIKGTFLTLFVRAVICLIVPNAFYLALYRKNPGVYRLKKSIFRK